jgi:Diacylglycerol acyltransferase
MRGLRGAGLRMHLMTLVINFYCPLLKEVLLLHGICNCSVEACRNILSKYSPPPRHPCYLPTSFHCVGACTCVHAWCVCVVGVCVFCVCVCVWKQAFFLPAHFMVHCARMCVCVCVRER